MNASESLEGLGTFDFVVVVAYVLVTLGIVYRASRHQHNTDDYFPMWTHEWHEGQRSDVLGTPLQPFIPHQVYFDVDSGYISCDDSDVGV